MAVPASAWTGSEDEMVVLELRISRQDLERLERLVRERPGTPKTVLARTAFELGLDALEHQPPPSDEHEDQAPPGRVGRATAGHESGAVPSSTKANLDRLKMRLDRLETQVKEFFDSQEAAKQRTKKKP